MKFKNGSVWPYKFETLKNMMGWAALRPDTDRMMSQRINAFVKDLDDSNIALYLDGYLKEFCRDESFHAKAIIVELDYIDRDFMREYSGFYSSGYQYFEKRTTRLHFFSQETSQADFNTHLTTDGTARESFGESYLGFTVIRPMPQKFVGRTCLKHYPSEKKGKIKGESGLEVQKAVLETRHYPVTNRYRVNLFGLELTVDSVAFQEQDSVVGVCATAALYALFHGAQRLLNNQTYCGLEITRLANNANASIPSALSSGEVVRSIPNTGLSIEQMYRVVTDANLSPVVFGAGLNRVGHKKTLGSLYAYLSLGLPVLAFVNFGQKSSTNEDLLKYVGHAFTITGFSLSPDVPEQLQDLPATNAAKGHQNGQAETRYTPHLLSTHVNKLYVHDDNIGPFSKFRVAFLKIDRSVRMALHPEAIKRIGENGQTVDVLPYRKVFDNGDHIDTFAFPMTFLVAASEKLRLDFDYAIRVVNALNPSLLVAPDVLEEIGPVDYVWDVKYATVEQIRQSWRHLNIPEDIRQAYLLQDLPKYCVRLICSKRTGEVRTDQFEVLLDATATDALSSILLAIYHCDEGDKTLSDMLAHLRGSSESDTSVGIAIVARFLQLFQEDES